MTGANNFKEAMAAIVQEVTGGSRLLQGRTQLPTDAVKGIPLTLRDFDLVTFKRDEIETTYAVCVFDEYPESYYNAGKQLTEICAGIAEAGLQEMLQQEGYKIMLETKTTKKGQRFTAVKAME